MKRETAAIVVVSFAACLVVTVAQPRCADDDAPVDAYVAALRAGLRKQADLVQDGDLVLIHPPWRDDVVDALRGSPGPSGALSPPVPVPLPEGTIVTEAFAPRHGDDWPSLVIVADRRWPLPVALRQRAADTLAAAAIRAAADVDDDDAEAGSAVIVFRLPAPERPRGLDLARARVTVTPLAGAVDNSVDNDDVSARDVVVCPWNAVRARHVCPGLPSWMTVGEDTLTIDGRPERCTWAHPRTGAVVEVDFGAVDLGGAALRLSLALADGAADNDGGAPVTATLTAGTGAAATVATVTVQGEQGFHDVDLTPPVAVPGARVSVRVAITTPHDGQRHTCFRLARVTP